MADGDVVGTEEESQVVLVIKKLEWREDVCFKQKGVDCNLK